MPSLPFPARSFLGVFENDSGVQQLLPDLIGAREIAIFLGCARSAISASTCASECPPRLEDGRSTSKIRSNSIQQIQRRRHVSGAKFARIHGGVGVAHVFKKRRQRLGRVQIVVQAFFEALRGRRRSAPPASRSCLPGYLSVSRRSLKFRSRSIAVAAAFSPSKVKFSFLR